MVRRAPVRFAWSPLALVVAVVIGCGARDEADTDVAPAKVAPLTAAQVTAAKQVGLLPSGLQPEIFDPPAGTYSHTFGYDIGNDPASTIVGSTSDSYIDQQSGYPGRGFMAGTAPTASPVGPSAMTYTSYVLGINAGGVMVGQGGPASNDWQHPFICQKDQPCAEPYAGQTPRLSTHTTLARPNNAVGSAGHPDIVGISWVGAGAVGYWPMNGTGDDLAGASPMTISADRYRPGRVGQSVHFDGSAGACLQKTNDDAAPYGGAGITMMAWVNPDRTICDGLVHPIVQHGWDYVMALQCPQGATAARITFLYYRGFGEPWQPAVGSVPLSDATVSTTPAWSHIAVTYDGRLVRTYHNGQLITEVTFGPIQGWAGPLTIGCGPGSQSFRGDLDEVAVFKHGMGPDQIAQYMQPTTTNNYGRIPQLGWQWIRYQDSGGAEPFISVIPSPTEDPYSKWGGALGVNDAGVVVGYQQTQPSGAQAMIYTPTDGLKNLNATIDPTTEWDLNHAEAINNAGQIVGEGIHHHHNAAFRFNPNTGELIDLAEKAEAPFNQTSRVILARGINSSGHVIGSLYTDQYGFWEDRAFIYTDESGLTDLNDLIDPNSTWILRSGAAINDKDQVVGWAEHKQTGQRRAYRLTVPPLPALTVASCLGRPDGSSCDGGPACPGGNVVNVCYQGTCGGGMAGICLRADGVVDTGDGQHFVAAFGYDSSATVTQHPATNQVLLGGTVVPNPQPAPPAWFPSGANPGVFLPQFTAPQTISWRVNGQMVTARATSTPLTPDTSGKVHIDQKDVVVRPNLAPYIQAPGPIFAQSEDHRFDFPGIVPGQLSVTPTGAATYTVPIAVPPGIAGVAPNLSLVYNSQAGNGIAGQGWDLAGLSTIHRCPKTRVQDGYARQVRMDFFYPEAHQQASTEQNKDGICLDGKRLFESDTAPGTYYLEQNDFSTISVTHDSNTSPEDDSGATFTVITKTGERRLYGSRPESRVTFPGPEVGGNKPEIAIWPLDRVIDAWGNYFDVEYYTDFQANGLRVKQISYTGHVAGHSTAESSQGSGVTDTFNIVTFQYELRADVRHQRFAQWTIPRNNRLKAITTPAGVYTLDYMPADTGSVDDQMLPSRLSSISYASGSDHLESINFGWEGGGYSWYSLDPIDPFDPNVQGYNAPARLDGFTDSDGRWHYSGSQIIDLNGDGLADFVHAKVGETRLFRVNNENGWVVDPTMPTFPGYLTSSDDRPIGMLADMDGDGIPDLVTHETPGPSRVYLNRLLQTHTWVEEPLLEGSMSFQFDTTDKLADMDGDGRADLVRTVDRFTLKVFLNRPTGWVESTEYAWPSNFGPATSYHPEDINRDGLADMVCHDPNEPSTAAVLLNTGTTVGHAAGTVWGGGLGGTIDPVSYANRNARAVGDIDGDGIYDHVTLYHSFTNSSDSISAVNVGTGTYFTPLGAEAYLADLQLFGIDPTTHAASAFSMADLNGDGLAELILGAGRVLLNTGEHWKDLAGATSYQSSAGDPKLAVPVLPTATNGAAFVDIDGDGIADLVQSTPTVRHAWLNTFRAPIIRTFPNGVTIHAKDTVVDYKRLTAPAARTLGVYSESGQLATGTKFMMAPIKVVASVTKDGATITGTDATTRYKYTDLRASINGRGPQGFGSVSVTDPANVTTSTNYAQVYPFTGLPVQIGRLKHSSSSSSLLGFVTNQYCAGITDVAMGNCYNASVPPSEIIYPPRTKTFVYPLIVTDMTMLYGDNGTTTSTTTSTETHYDEDGNPVYILLTATSASGEKHQTTTRNTYGPTPDSPESKLGKLKYSEVTKQRIAPIDGYNHSRVHKTAFDYDVVNTFFGGPNGTALTTLGLTRTRVEPDSTVPGQELHTLYKYDRFGNVLRTMSCASDFTSCQWGQTNPGDAQNPLHPPYRLTTTSYDPMDFNPPGGPGPLGTISYTIGRFPVMTTNAAGHTQYMVYHPLFGALRQKTDPNGMHTCYSYDFAGRKTDETELCGSISPPPRTTTYRQYEAAPTLGDPALAKLITVTRSPTGSSSWVYSDAQGRTIATRGRSFDGGFTETATSYDDQGRLASTTKPHLMGDPTFSTVPGYDALDRPHTITDELGVIERLGRPAVSTVTTTYLGSTISVDHAVTGDDGTIKHQTRAETKNVLGKVSIVTDDASTKMHYFYDGDGNLTDSCDDGNGVFFDRCDPVPNHIHIDYDDRGRKIGVQDPDVGPVSFLYNGFGDLILQTDAKGAAIQMVYDNLGRMISKTESQKTAEWVYDVPEVGMNRLAAVVGPPDAKLAVPCTISHAHLTDGNRSGRWFTYTPDGQVENTYECIEGEAFATHYEYDTVGRQSVVTYPAVKGVTQSVWYHYTNLGFLQYVSDPSNAPFVVFNAMNALGQVLNETTRNGVQTVRDRNPNTGWLLNSHSTSLAENYQLIQNWGYEYDEVGNLKKRHRSDDLYAAQTDETFTYDSLNRIETSGVVIGGIYDSGDHYYYDPLGNITSKRGDSYTYNSGCQAGLRTAGPHTVCSIGSSPAFGYDGNGNMTSGLGRMITYNAANKVVQVTRSDYPSAGDGPSEVEFAYDAEGNRVVQNVTQGTTSARTLYVGMGGTGKSLYERTTRNGVVEHVQFLYAGGDSAFAVRVTTDDGTTAPVSMSYYHTDHLGSVTAMSDDNGRVVGGGFGGPDGTDATMFGYDPWGARRSPDGHSSSATFKEQPGRREFTGHEAVASVGLVNMNGRMYDPKIGRFISPDPTIQFVGDLQSFNRYTYVGNNPLRYTDPTGYDWNSTVGTIVGVGITAAGIITCAPTAVGCIAAFTGMGILWTSTVMYAEGASVDQIVAADLFSAMASLASAGAGGLVGEGFGSVVIRGAVGAATGQAMTDLANRGGLGWDVVSAAAKGAAEAAAVYAIAATIQVSLASAAEAQGEHAFNAPKDGGGDGKPFGFDIETRPGQNDFQLDARTREKLQPIFGPKVHLEDVRLSFYDNPDITERAEFVASKNRIFISQDFHSMNVAYRDYLLVHEVAHYAQFVNFNFNVAKMNARGDSECIAYACEGSYRRPEALKNTSLSDLNIIDSRFRLEAIAHHIGLGVTGYQFSTVSSYSNY